MNVKETLISQYYASLSMLKNAITGSDNEMWNDQAHKNRFWHVAYHTLFFADLYSCREESSFVPWVKHRAEYQFLGPVPWPPHHEPNVGDPYERPEILEYYESLRAALEGRIQATELDGPSGFFWLPFSKLELQLYNIRHIQHHAGQLIERLREQKGIGTSWVARGETKGAVP